MGHYDRQGRWKGSGQPGQPPAPAGARRGNPDGAAGGERTRAAQAGSDSGREAQSLAREAFEAMLKQTPEARHTTLRSWAKSMGYEEAPTP